MLVDEKYFACKPLVQAINSLPTSSLLLPAILHTLMLAIAYDMNWQMMLLDDLDPRGIFWFQREEKVTTAEERNYKKMLPYTRT